MSFPLSLVTLPPHPRSRLSLSPTPGPFLVQQLLGLPFLALGRSETTFWLSPPSVHLYHLRVPPTSPCLLASLAFRAHAVTSQGSFSAPRWA